MKPLDRFRADARGHSSTNAYLCAFLSLYAYDEKPPGRGSYRRRLRALLADWSERYSLDRPDERATVLSSRATAFPYDTQAYVASNSRAIFVVFRGSEGGPTTVPGLRDWLTNAQANAVAPGPHWGSGVRVHEGFWRALATVHRSLRSEVRARLAEDRRPVFLCGHSLGGALATLCAFQLHVLGSVEVAGVYTFGAPRVGNRAFMGRYDAKLGDRTHRWVRGHDFGPMLPHFTPPFPFEPYRHVGSLNHVSSGGRVQIGVPDFTPIGLPSERDHDLIGYTQLLWGRLSGRRRAGESDPRYLVREDVLVPIAH